MTSIYICNQLNNSQFSACGKCGRADRQTDRQTEGRERTGGEKVSPRSDDSNLLIVPPRLVVHDNGRARDVVPESGVFHRVDHLLGVGVQVHTEHDAAEGGSEGVGEVRVLHASESSSGERVSSA